jgi:hypothetical protein
MSVDGCQECIGKECVCAYITGGCAAPVAMGMFHQWWLCCTGGGCVTPVVAVELFVVSLE